MGLGDRLKQVAEGVGNIFTAPVGLVWDSARAITSDEYNPGFFGVFGPATEQAVTGLSNIGEGLGFGELGRMAGESSIGPTLRFFFDEAEKIYSSEFQRQVGEGVFGLDPGTFSVQRALATGTGAAGTLVGAGLDAIGLVEGSDLGDFNFYRQWQKAEFRTPGQAWVEQAIVPDFYTRNPREQDEIRESAWYNLISGSMDAAARWITDPGVLAGKGYKVARRKLFTFRPGLDDTPIRPSGHKAGLKKLGYQMGEEISGPDGVRMVRLKPGRKREVYTVTRTSILEQVRGEGRVRIPEGLDDAVDEAVRIGIPEQDIAEVRRIAVANGVPENQVDEFMDNLVRSTASEQVNQQAVTKGIVGEKANLNLQGQRYPGTQHRPLHLINDLDEAKRYASALYKTDPTDMPVVLRLDADGLPAIYEEFDVAAVMNPKDLPSGDVNFSTLADDIEDHIIKVERPGPDDLDDALHLDGNPPPHTVDRPGYLNPRLYDPDGSPIEPDLAVDFEGLRDDLVNASRLYGDSPEAAERYLLGRQRQRNQRLLLQGNPMAERAAKHKVLQSHLNWLDNNGKGRDIDEIRRTLFPNTPFGDVIASWLTKVDNYHDRRTVLLASMGYKLPEFDGLEASLRHQINTLLDEADRIAAGNAPSELVNEMLGLDTKFSDMTAPYMQDFIAQELDSMVDSDRYYRFLDRISDMAPIHQLRFPVSRAAGNFIRKTSWYQSKWLGRPIRNVIENRPHQWISIKDPMSDIQIARQLEEAAPLGIGRDDVVRFRQEYVDAATEQAREGVVFRMERFILEKAAEKAKLTPDEFEELIRRSRAGVQGARDHIEAQILESRRYASSDRDLVQFFDPTTGEINIMPMPLLSSQTRTWIPLANAQEIVRLSRKIGRLRARFGPNVRLTDVMDLFYRVWKPTVLLRGGWMVRVVSDEQLRVLAKTGSLLTHIAAISTGEVPKFTSMFGADLTMGQRLGAFGATVTGTQPLTALTVRAARGVTRIAESLNLLDPKVMEYMRAIGDENLVSARATFGGMNENSLRQLQALMGRDELTAFNHLSSKSTGQWRSIGPEDPNFAQAWGRVLTHQYGQDPLGRKVIQEALARKMFEEGQITSQNRRGLIDSVKSFLKDNPEGREIAERMPWRARDPEGWVNDVVEELFDYTGGFQENLLRGALDNKVTRKMLEDIDESLRPQTVHSEIVAQTLGNHPVIQYINDTIATGFDLMGRLPTDTLSRQPMFKELYAAEMTRLERLRAKQGLVTDEAALSRMNSQARQFAINEVKDYLYDLAEVSRFGYMMRAFMPFYPAWQEVLTVWGRLAMEDPSIIARARILWEAPNKAGIVQKDDEGEEWIQLRLSERTAEDLGLTGWQKYVATGGLRFGKSSFNLVLNNPLPSFGPLVQIPINEVVKKKPSLEATLEWALPFGTAKDAWSIVSSPLVRQMKSEIEGPKGDDAWIRAYVDALTWMDVEYRAGRRNSPPTPKEAEEVAFALRNIRLITRLISPSQPVFDSPLEPYFTAYRDMMDNLGPDKAHEAFLNEYGEEFFAVTISRTKSITGIPPTVEAEEKRKEYSALVEKYPEYGRLIVGDEGLGEFSSAAFYSQQETPVDPDNPFSEVDRTQRPFELDPRTGRIMEADRRLGWQEYINFIDLIDLERRKRGLPNLQVKAAQDLAALKKQGIRAIGEKYPAWKDDFATRDDLKWDKRVEAFKAISSASTHEDRADIQGLQDYLEFRGLVAQELNRRRSLGGASTLQAASNQDLAILWETAVNKIIEENIAFGPLYYRYLEGDPVSISGS